MNDQSIQTIIQQILDNMPAEWAVLTTHRLDIYDESQAKVQFVEHLQTLIEQGSLDMESLAALPTAYDYVRLGHQLSSVLEWAIAQEYRIHHRQVISFASQTMPLLAVLRSNTVHGRRTMVYHDCDIPDVLSMPEIETVYGYSVECVRIESESAIPLHEDAIAVFVTAAQSMENRRLNSADCTINLASEFGSVLIVHPREEATIAKWISEIQHVRRRECIAVTPPYAERMLQEMIGGTPPPIEAITEEDWAKIASAVQQNIGTSVQPLIASSGLSTQYAIMMGLLDHARQHHPEKAIQFLIPPNCYGGTNDQARRVATLCEDVSIVDLPVDSGHSMTNSLERRLQEAAAANAVPYVLVEIPTNPRVEVPDMKHLEEVLGKRRTTPMGVTAVPPLFIIDQTFCPNVPLLSENSPLAKTQTLAYISGSKFPSGGRCTGGFVTANQLGAEVMDSIAKHLRICDNQATPLQMKILAEMMPSMADRIAQAYSVTRQFVDHIQATLPNTKISFIDEGLVSMGFTPSVFSLDLPSTGSTPEEREENKRLLNLRMIDHIITALPNSAKHCVSYGQLAKTYFTVPATSTQGTTKESDKDYIVRIAMPPEMDMVALLTYFDEFVQRENLAMLI